MELCEQIELNILQVAFPNCHEQFYIGQWWMELVMNGTMWTNWAEQFTGCFLNISPTSVVVETVSETSHLRWNNETIRFKSSLTSIIIESTHLTLNMNKIWSCFKVQVGWKKCILWGNWVSKRSRKGLGETLTIKKQTFVNLHFKCQQNNNLSVFNVQIIRLHSLVSWNIYVPDNFKN